MKLWIQVNVDSRPVINLGVCCRSPTASAVEVSNIYGILLSVIRREKSLQTYCTNLVQHVNAPVRGSSVLDLVISSETNVVQD